MATETVINSQELEISEGYTVFGNLLEVKFIENMWTYVAYKYVGQSIGSDNN